MLGEAAEVERYFRKMNEDKDERDEGGRRDETCLNMIKRIITDGINVMGVGLSD